MRLRDYSFYKRLIEAYRESSSEYLEFVISVSPAVDSFEPAHLVADSVLKERDNCETRFKKS